MVDFESAVRLSLSPIQFNLQMNAHSNEFPNLKLITSHIFDLNKILRNRSW